MVSRNSGRKPITDGPKKGNPTKDFAARSNPVFMIFEDAHWIDPTSLEALEQAARDAAEQAERNGSSPRRQAREQPFARQVSGLRRADGQRETPRPFRVS
jgi:hypothetical protein